MTEKSHVSEFYAFIAVNCYKIEKTEQSSSGKGTGTGMNQFIRTEMLLGEEAMSVLAHARVAVFGIGGVGGYVVEALARSGIGALDLIDHDIVSESNINRQIIALYHTIGQKKTEVMAERVRQINPEAAVRTFDCFYLPESADQFDFTQYDYVVDAIDTITAKLDLIVRANQSHTPIISAMGAGNKLDPSRFEITDIYATSVCPLARVMRRELKQRGIEKLKVVYSKEQAITPVLPKRLQEQLNRELAEEAEPAGISEPAEGGKQQGKRMTPGSISFVPAVAGLMLAGEVINDLIKRKR